MLVAVFQPFPYLIHMKNGSYHYYRPYIEIDSLIFLSKTAYINTCILYYMELDKYLACKNPQLSIHTRRVYSSQLMRMVSKLNMLIDDISDFDKYKDDIFQYLDSIPDNSRKSTCSAYLALGANNDVNTMIKAKYHSKNVIVNHDERIYWLHLIEQYKTYYRHCVKYYFERMPNITFEQYMKVQSYVYLSCNILSPPRPNSFWINLKKSEIELIGGDKHLKSILNKWIQVQIYSDYLFNNFIDRSLPITEIQLINYHHFIRPAYKIPYSIETLINSYKLYKLDNNDNIDNLLVSIKPTKVKVCESKSITVINKPIQVFFD